jgi:hypothetical protein
MDLIQAELYMTSEIQKNIEILYGRPDIMYFVPGIYGGHNCDHRVDQEDIKICQNFLLKGLIKTEKLVRVLSPNNGKFLIAIKRTLNFYR